MTLRKKSKQKSFTLIEVLIVIAIIGILGAIAVPQFAAYSVRGFNATALSDIKNAFTAAQAYFSDYPTDTTSLAILTAYDFSQSDNITLGGADSFKADSGTLNSYHASGDTTYSITSSGAISQYKNSGASWCVSQ